MSMSSLHWQRPVRVKGLEYEAWYLDGCRQGLAWCSYTLLNLTCKTRYSPPLAQLLASHYFFVSQS